MDIIIQDNLRQDNLLTLQIIENMTVITIGIEIIVRRGNIFSKLHG